MHVKQDVAVQCVGGLHLADQAPPGGNILPVDGFAIDRAGVVEEFQGRRREGLRPAIGDTQMDDQKPAARPAPPPPLPHLPPPTPSPHLTTHPTPPPPLPPTQHP